MYCAVQFRGEGGALSLNKYESPDIRHDKTLFHKPISTVWDAVVTQQLVRQRNYIC